MSDEVTRILLEHAASRHESAGGDGYILDGQANFDERGYLLLNPDVAEAIQSGEVTSGYHHYMMYGQREGRKVPGGPFEPLDRLVVTAGHQGLVSPGGQPAIAHSVEAVIFCPDGGLMIEGWINDAFDPIECVRVSTPSWRVLIDRSKLVRVRRLDVEAALGTRGTHCYGLLGFLHFDRQIPAGGDCTVVMQLCSGATVEAHADLRSTDDLELRNVLLAQLGKASFFGQPHIEGMIGLNAGIGDEIVRFNRTITNRVVATPYVERFGPRLRKPLVSLIVCLYGKAEFQFIQSCLYAGLPGIENYEFIYVSNSPELADAMLREARNSTLAYGIDQTIVILPGNAGFGGANNAAVKAARAKRVIAVNPDVFPRDPDWARKHLDIVTSRPANETRLFGAPLYYDDGSLMHGGMYFDIDNGLSMSSRTPQSIGMVRVEHYGKGAPSWSETYLRSRPVPAVTGAFISADRAWFEKLGGFTEDYVFGHYEDADLCLKSLGQGSPAWLHDVRMWHLEGKGSTRLPPHEGGSLVNRWLFSKTWLPSISPHLVGQNPTHPLLSQGQDESPPPAAKAGSVVAMPEAPSRRTGKAEKTAQPTALTSKKARSAL